VSRGESGSALIEALVAAAIVMVSLSTMYQALMDGAVRARQGADRAMALLVAQSELATVGSVIPAQPGQATGIEGPYEWEIAIEPFEPDGRPLDRSLVEVTARVGYSGAAGALVTLHTVRLSNVQ